MPGIVRKLLIFAAVDGLVLQPAPPRNHKPSTDQAIKIAYNSHKIGPLLRDRRDEDTEPASPLEAHGIVGMLKVSSNSYLISISRREQVASIRGKTVYQISDVAIIPLSSQEDAEKAIVHARASVQGKPGANELEEMSDTESSDDADTLSLNEDEAIRAASPQEPELSQQPSHKRQTSVAEDVINKKGVYGRFTSRWFSRKGWGTEGRRAQGMSSEEDLNGKVADNKQNQPSAEEKDEAIEAANSPMEDAQREADRDIIKPPAPTDAPKTLGEVAEDNTVPLLSRILRTTKIYLGSRSFFFSYDYDISHSIDQQRSPSSSIPLHKSFDPLYFWNRKMIEPFLDAGQHSFVVPLIQGFAGQRAFAIDTSETSSPDRITESETSVDEIIAEQEDGSASIEETRKREEAKNKKEFLLTVVSRRSVKRAGLRYLRRGVDEEGNVANSVETEQILSRSTWDSPGDSIHSFVQYRGSIPLFFSQSPYSLKPQVNSYGSPEINEAAFRLHFQQLFARYGNVYADSLVDKHGTEAKIGDAFEKYAVKLNEQGGIDGKGTKLGFEWFDFHSVCRGMKFENVAQLMETLGPSLSTFGWTTLQDDKVLQKQSGIVRTNCMDCLDRTNVVQSALARRAIEKQLAEQDITIDLQTDPSTSWFNSLWADNGDAISKQYSGTAALKGDFTRTRQRKISGALTDFGLTLTRYYRNIFNDYFAQALIDYLLGRATEDIFAEFEADMKAQDYAVDLRKVRQNAIDNCIKIVVEDPAEDLIAGWTFSCPAQPNTLRSLPFEECVLLLTEKTLYFCRFDWTTEKVREFEPIELENVIGLTRGAYITSTLAKRHMDEKKNVGFAIRYHKTGRDLVRVNTRSLNNERQPDSGQEGKKEEKGGDERILAFKSLPPQSSFVSYEGHESAHGLSEEEMATSASEEILKMARKARGVKPEVAVAGEDEEGKKALEVEEKDIISLADAKKSTGYLEQLGYSIKKFVWA